MKLNYFTYTVIFKDTGTVCNICIADIVENYCKHQSKKSVLEKYHDKSSKKLYFAMAGTFPDVYYLMVPASLANYRTLNKGSGVIKDLDEVLEDGDSLEKVTYIHFDKSKSIIGVTSSLGGASVDDLQYYLNEVLNGIFEPDIEKYQLKIIPLQSELTKSSVGNLRLISQANVILNGKTSLNGIISGLLTGDTSDNNVEISINIKRTGVKNGIEKDIKPLLDLIQSDISGKDFAEVHLRAKRNSLQENIKDYYLDHSMILFDIINPYLKASIEIQIQDKRYSNQAVIDAYNTYIEGVDGRITTNHSCTNWSKLSVKETYLTEDNDN
ncbi:hypothetical protein L0668_20455 [Paraglaciecola aquimarina]|uniref:Baseplate protein J-like domain-containing protein n=1 Tax=Paraglaciecola algarum TaxID=3050085 RepID=A0ABS9DDR6_9ALTE|nr:hypothetical protein [Paraglaciecola sp. G1-23]MCF2950492.1 hypothetical protein [Paraglaciecola sp. G1-23]